MNNQNDDHPKLETFDTARPVSGVSLGLVQRTTRTINRFPRLLGVNLLLIIIVFIVLNSLALAYILHSSDGSKPGSIKGIGYNLAFNPSISLPGGPSSPSQANSSKSTSSASSSTTATVPPRTAGGATPSSPSTVNPSCTSSDTAVSDPTAVHGIFMFGGYYPSSTTGQQETKYLLNNPDICGISLSVVWSKIDNGPGSNPRYDWSSVEAQIAPWEAAGKVVNLLVQGASESGNDTSSTPQYVQNQVTMINCSSAGIPPTPVFWQSGYMSNYEAFIADTVSQFNSDPHIGYIRFGFGNGAEDVIDGPNKVGSCLSQWDNQGYPNNWYNYNSQLLSYIGSLQTSKLMDVSLNDYENSPPITTHAMQAASLGIAIGYEDMKSEFATAILDNKTCPNNNICSVLAIYAGKVPIHVQDYRPTTPISGAAGEGLLPQLLQADLKIHAQILEMYPQDLLLAVDPSYPGYGQYGTSYAQALANTAAVVGTTGGVKPQN